MDNWRVYAATIALTLIGWWALFAWLYPIPDGLMVLALATVVGVARFAALCAFDDGTRT